MSASGKQLFGTDGVRGFAGEYPLDRPTMYALGAALGRWIGTHHLDPEVAIGMDTRESGPWIAEHLTGGLAEHGVRARSAGLITTPGLAHVARTGPFAAGLMISASHNPYTDNGVKIFDHSGFKLPDREEATIEKYMLEFAGTVQPREVATDASLDGAYIDHLAATVPNGLAGLHVVIDPANGAATYLAPALFERLGARVECIHNHPDGRNINLNCGSLHLESLREHVVRTGATMGVAFDGDADRALFVCRSGKIIDGDAVLLMNAVAMKVKEVVATVMSNLGLERALERHGIGMVRTPVGDKYVLEEMVKRGAPLGGEQSGHIIFREFATTGDGMLTALRVCEIVHETGRSLGDLTSELEIYPQLLVNVRVKNKRPLEELTAVTAEIRRAEAEFGPAGRVLVRFSGTEPLARVMVEGPENNRVEHYAHAIAEVLQAELGG